MKSVRTPLGLTLPSGVYAAVVSLAITSGSALTMARLDLPWWAWVIQFFVLLGVTFTVTENSATPAGEGVFTVTNARTLALAGGGLVLFVALLVILLVLRSE
ncbi:MAG: hypothetical protein U5O16_25910 [Rhodococcus sp. (in: high G+C Gram-positive bacteria)]|uniref:hypothetical protein n=1 Tax=Rhodococcus sp. TaxID=1831 RepID=UPI002ADA8238|nr:hypothetical protein [Rhodococcus sp. (in: high G+C Gram-positive bacteria)]